ncbi:MAG: hypothetical protein EPN25_08720 [Nitrospirae bacterium]|nr:MAG: hypothetical protein EPN25_08720 [Nitrospirota bacterium]
MNCKDCSGARLKVFSQNAGRSEYTDPVASVAWQTSRVTMHAMSDSGERTMVILKGENSIRLVEINIRMPITLIVGIF